MTAKLGYRRGVGIMLLDQGNRVFVGRRIGMPDSWQMPQGGIDKDESPRKAAIRELREETGTDKARIIAESAKWLRYDLPPALRGRTWGGGFRGQEQKWFALRFTGTDRDFDLAAHEPEFDAWKWVAAADLLKEIVSFKRALYQEVLAEFGGLLI